MQETVRTAAMRLSAEAVLCPEGSLGLPLSKRASRLSFVTAGYIRPSRGEEESNRFEHPLAERDAAADATEACEDTELGRAREPCAGESGVDCRTRLQTCKGRIVRHDPRANRGDDALLHVVEQGRVGACQGRVHRGLDGLSKKESERMCVRKGRGASADGKKKSPIQGIEPWPFT